MEPTWGGGTEVYSFGLGHMTKIATMPIYGKNIWKSSSQDPKGLWPWYMVCSINGSGPIKSVQMMTLGWPWPTLRQGQIRSFRLLYRKKVKR